MNFLIFAYKTTNYGKSPNPETKIKKYEKIILAALEEEAKGREYATFKRKSSRR